MGRIEIERAGPSSYRNILHNFRELKFALVLRGESRVLKVAFPNESHSQMIDDRETLICAGNVNRRGHSDEWSVSRGSYGFESPEDERTSEKTLEEIRAALSDFFKG